MLIFGFDFNSTLFVYRHEKHRWLVTWRKAEVVVLMLLHLTLLGSFLVYCWLSLPGYLSTFYTTNLHKIRKVNLITKKDSLSCNSNTSKQYFCISVLILCCDIWCQIEQCPQCMMVVNTHTDVHWTQTILRCITHSICNINCKALQCSVNISSCC